MGARAGKRKEYDKWGKKDEKSTMFYSILGRTLKAGKRKSLKKAVSGVGEEGGTTAGWGSRGARD